MKKKALIYFCNGNLDKLKNDPDIVRKGRWFYYKNGNELLYIKVITVHSPKGYKEYTFETSAKKIKLEELRRDK